MPDSRAQYFVSLKSKKSIESLFKTGGKIFGKHLMLRFNRVPESGHPPRVVFAVASRLGAAHERNRIKRRLREALFAVLKKGRVNGTGFDIALLPKKETADLDFGKLCDELQTALRKLPKTKDARVAPSEAPRP
ncbi:MAG: ribonuclease P protein component [Turneriella sp.]|nr:ribonuclease P protein component [Turneriella sp.]